ncbi:MAG: cysteine-rich CWC family protein [Candidatus Aphodosoma sp.]
MKNKTCPRCGKEFVCNHNDIANCQCASVHLSAEAHKYIATHYTDCLCADCLDEINRQHHSIC